MTMEHLFKKKPKKFKKIKVKKKYRLKIKAYPLTRCFECYNCSMTNHPQGAKYYCGRFFVELDDLEIIHEACRLKEYT